MKKVLLMAALMVGSSVVAFAQDVKALNDEAKALKAQYDKDFQAAVLGQADNVKLADLTLNLINKYYQIDKIAQQPDAKGKVNNKFRKANSATIAQIRTSLINGGIETINNDQNDKALAFFGAYVESADHEMMAAQNLAATDTQLPLIAYYASLAAARMENHEATIKYSKHAIKDPENGNNAYQFMCAALKALNRTDEWLSAIKEGMNLYPNDNFFSANMVDYYISNNKLDEALTYIDGEIGKNPGNYYNYYMKGFMLNQQKKYDEADEVYAKACTMNDDMVQLYSYAGLNLCQAAIELGEAEDADQNKINDYYKRALPYYTKARQLAPDDKTMWMNGLYTIYYRLNMEKEFKEIEALM